MHYYMHHIGDHKKLTGHFTFLELGVYQTMLDRYYDTEAPLPKDETALFRVVRLRSSEEQEAGRRILHDVFECTEAGWRHAGCDAAIALFKAKSAKSTMAANTRWKNHRDKQAHAAADMPPATFPSTLATPPLSPDWEPVRTPFVVDGSEEPVRTAPASAAPMPRPPMTDAPISMPPPWSCDTSRDMQADTPTHEAAPFFPEKNLPDANALPTVNQPPTPPIQPPTVTRRERGIAMRLPPDWQPSKTDVQFCQEHRPDLNPQWVAAGFRDYWHAQAGSTAKKLDWSATWRNWVRRERGAPPMPSRREAVSKDQQRQDFMDFIHGRTPHDDTVRIYDITPASLGMGRVLAA